MNPMSRSRNTTARIRLVVERGAKETRYLFSTATNAARLRASIDELNAEAALSENDPPGGQQ